MSSFPLADAFDVADLETFLTRARSADPGGAVRLAAHDRVLVVTTRLVPGSGLFGAGGVLGMRMFALRPDESGTSGPSGAAGASGERGQGGPDVVVEVDAVMDRLARMKRTGELDLAVPPVQVAAPWAGHAAPRSGWERVGDVDPDALREVARAGIAEIATGADGPPADRPPADATPDGDGVFVEASPQEAASGGRSTPPRSGALAVEELRRRVWTRPAPDLAGGPAGLAFGAHILGFLPPAARDGQPPAPPVLFRASPWWRLATPAGHVIAR